MNTRQYNSILLVFGLLISAAASSISANPAEVVRPEFLNELRIGVENPPAGQSNSMVLFGGNIDSPETAPSGAGPDTGTILLIESSFGQAFATDIPYPDFILDAALAAQRMLYAPAGWSRADVVGSDLVFRYKTLLYDGNNGGVAPDPAQVSSHFGDAERLKFVQAVKRMRDALKYAPYDRMLRNALLDAYHDLAVAEALFANVDRGEMAEFRLGLRTGPSGGFIIDQEIRLTAAIMASYERSLLRYGELLTDRMGVDLAATNPHLAGQMPLGAYIFQQEQPVRNQYAAQFHDTDGVLKTVPYYDPDLGETATSEAPRILFVGYKDYINLVGLLREYTASAAELARFYGMRGRRAPVDDIESAFELISKVQRETQLQVLWLRGMFPDYEPSPGDASGLSAALHGLGVALAELDHVRTFLDGKSNLLGFDPNFLVLIKEAPDGSDHRFDSYDALMHWIGARTAPTPYTPLGYASQAFEAARTSHGTYRGYADQVWDQLDRIANTYSDRYFEITGWEPGDTTKNHLLEPDPGSELEPGSELWQAHQSVTMMNKRVASILEQAERLDEILFQAGRVVTSATSKKTDLETAKQNYFDETSNKWDELHAWRGAMAGSQAIFETVASACTVDGIATIASAGSTLVGVAVVGALNAAVQTTGAVRSSIMEQRLQRAAANFEVSVMQLDIPAEIAQAKIEYEDRHREQIALALEMEDALSMQRQEIARRDTLVRELERIKQQAAESDAGLADRYFADPLHFLRAQNDMILADQAFREAQRWVFFALRALEFKWNKDFVISWLGRGWELSSLFRLRNYSELEQIVGAMEEFNRVNLINFNREAFLDVISLRDDIMAPAAGGFEGLWLDVATGDRVTAIELFRRKLSRSLDEDGNLVIPLNTFALRKDTGFFFLGPRYRTNGTVLTAGKYLDKIDWIKFNVVGSHAAATRDANLSYGGTCYLRTRMPPCGDLADPFRLSGEYRAFPFYYFRTLDNGVTWETLTAQEDTVKVAFTRAPGEPEPDLLFPHSLLKNHFLKERSVAATHWVLELPAGTFNLNQIDDIEIWIRHQFVSREMPSCGN